MFNGRNLDGWQVYNCEAEMKDGNLALVSGNGWLRAQQLYTDFVLDLEWKAAGYAAQAFPTRRQRLLLLTRLTPLVQRNLNLVELGPRQTGKLSAGGRRGAGSDGRNESRCVILGADRREANRAGRRQGEGQGRQRRRRGAGQAGPDPRGEPVQGQPVAG